ncbi:DUF4389 domain-containing protein [Aeromicrobium sp. NPDC092404]|uniref:DUF4389 domain-containing protein n=1 Tax=Aeromicrobium sp. NPDC092404 TaxID=3154976 RepID=UPI003415E314
MSAVSPPPPPAAAPAPSDYPATFTFDSPGTVARWRPLIHWLLVIPHVIVLYVLNLVAGILVFVAWIVGVITGKIPEGIQGLIVAALRYGARVQTYMLFLRGEYPPFAFDTEFTDPGTDARVRLDFQPEIENRSRLTIFFRGLLLIPHFFVFFFLAIAMYVVVIIGWFAVIILGRWPSGLESFVVGFIRWMARFNAYANLLTDKYPPFGLK